MKTLPALLSLLIWFSAGLSAQVLLVSPQPTLAPKDCPCVDCKCVDCKCDLQIKPATSVVKKSYTPTEASVIVRATKGKEIAQCSGTAVDEHTVVSCWHVTRGDGWTYTVNGKPATLLRSDSKADVALFATSDSLKPVPVANEPLKAGSECHAYGFEFDKKGLLYRWRTKVNAVNRYRGFPNVSILGRPLSGRSGGGLFNSKGELVGVCSAADGQEGLYCGLDAIKALLNPDKTPLKVSGNVAAKTTPFLLQDCPTGTCPLIPKQAPPKSLPAGVKTPASVSPGSSGSCPTCPQARVGTPSYRVPSTPSTRARGILFWRRR